MNAVLSRQPRAPVPWPQTVLHPTIEVSEDELQLQARTQNPQLRALQHDVERSRAAQRLARLDALPDLTFAVDYIATGAATVADLPGSGTDAVVAGVSFDLPLWYEKHNALQRESGHLHAASEQDKHRAENQLLAELQQADVRGS